MHINKRDQWREQQMREGPQAERGAVFSGPDSGYKVPGLTLHGDEAIVPVIDNNYTQGEPSAVDGKVKTSARRIYGSSYVHQCQQYI